MQTTITVDVSDDTSEVAEGVKRAYTAWPTGHRMHAHLPGLVAAIILDGIDFEVYTLDQAPEVLASIFDKAGLADHAHMAEVEHIVGEVSRL